MQHGIAGIKPEYLEVVRQCGVMRQLSGTHLL